MPPNTLPLWDGALVCYLPCGSAAWHQAPAACPVHALALIARRPALTGVNGSKRAPCRPAASSCAAAPGARACGGEPGPCDVAAAAMASAQRLPASGKLGVLPACASWRRCAYGMQPGAQGSVNTRHFSPAPQPSRASACGRPRAARMPAATRPSACAAARSWCLQL